jgi:energy-converting hydrogenase Eha subunit B
MHEYDDIDRALFALPLEAPPQGLREAILRSTVHAPRRVAATAPAFLWESIGVGVSLALAVWLTIALVANPGFAAQALSALIAFGRVLTDPATLTWLAVGASATLWLSIVTLRPVHARARSGRT